MACPHCGSWSVKADRSLAGRMVCGRCGRPLGPGSLPAARRSGFPRWRRRSGLLPLLLPLLLLSAVLAWLAEAPRPRPSMPLPGAARGPQDLRW